MPILGMACGFLDDPLRIANPEKDGGYLELESYRIFRQGAATQLESHEEGPGQESSTDRSHIHGE